MTSQLITVIGTRPSRRHILIVAVERPREDAAPRIALTLSGSSGARRIELHAVHLPIIEAACAELRRQLDARDDDDARAHDAPTAHQRNDP